MTFDSLKPTEQITQVVPADGWYAEFAADDGQPYHVRLAAWGLVERFDNGSVRRELRGLGSWNSPQIVKMLPNVGGLNKIRDDEIDESALVRMEAILNSMTPQERALPQIINGSRKKRIARGSGTTVQEINRLLKQYLAMKKMMKTFSKGMGPRRFGRLAKGLPPELFH
jgi:hypothetical protein